MSEPGPAFKSGFVAVVGRPNVGKSTLMNAFLGQKLAAVSPKPQTTYRRQLGILTRPGAQVIFIDTPGMHKPVHKLGEFMNEEAESALGDADLVLFLADASAPPTSEDHLLAEKILALRKQPAVLLALNKIDLVPVGRQEERRIAFQALLPSADVLSVSALTGFQRQQLLDAIITRLPEGPQFYDDEQVTDLYEREIAADLVREAVMLHLRDEIPHSVAVRMDEFKERSADMSYISATLLVERDSQKGIVIGQNGAMLKQIGTSARQAIEEMCGRRVYLELHVKVQKNWRNSPEALRWLGLSHHKE
jgi:GTP-binding protein Era